MFRLDGATGDGGDPNTIATDLQAHPAIGEGRVGATIVETVASADGTPLVVRTERVTLRTLAVPPYAMIAGTSDAAAANEVATAADAGAGRWLRPVSRICLR